MTRTTPDELTTLWAGHSALPFPDGLRGLDAPTGESVAALDAYMAGCITAYLSTGTLDTQRYRTLRACAEQLGGVLPQLGGEDADYVSRLLQVAERIAADAARTHCHFE
ncbi:hypothetical protein [Spirillospora sp. NPDC029432]|uniref:hypothetical protein n=1 Tax=Spirillospora sp. NPDC029432 TaxID=3154599 RepID=UPI0034556A86